MITIDAILIYIVLPYSAITGVTLFYYRTRGFFRENWSRYTYIGLGFLNGGLAGLVMYAYEDRNVVLWLCVAVILFYVFIFNAPIPENSENINE